MFSLFMTKTVFSKY